MNALALTDHGNLYGALEFYAGLPRRRASIRSSATRPTSPRAAGSSGAAHRASEASYHLTLLAQNRTGFQEPGASSPAGVSRRLLPQAADRQGAAGRAQRGHHLPERLRVGRVQPHAARGQHGRRRDLRRGSEIAAWFQQRVRRPLLHRDSEQRPRNPAAGAGAAVEVAQRMGLPLVATSDAHYVRREDAVAQDVLLVHQHGQVPHRHQPHADGGRPVLPPQPGGNVRRASRAAKTPSPARSRSPTRSTSTWSSASGTSRRSSCRRQKTPADYLRELCVAGLQRALRRRSATAGRTATQLGAADEVLDRLDRELAVINKLGFSDYFLIVWDFVRYAARARHSLHGPRLAASARSCATRCTSATSAR